MQIVQSREKKLHKSRLHEVLSKWEIKEYYGIFRYGQFDKTSTQFQQQNKAVLQEKFKGAQCSEPVKYRVPRIWFLW